MPTKKEQEFRRRYHRQIFYAPGSQYYTMARFAMHAQCIPVCGNLFFRSPRTASPMRAFFFYGNFSNHCFAFASFC